MRGARLQRPPSPLLLADVSPTPPPPPFTAADLPHHCAAGLGEHRLRDLNDEINKLMREKGHWERRIRELGGQDYRHTRSAVAKDGRAPRGARGYMYFGAAKNLPGVRELFEEVRRRSAVGVATARSLVLTHVSPCYPLSSSPPSPPR